LETRFTVFSGKKYSASVFFITSIGFSLCGFAIFSTIYFLLNTDPICKYPVDWCNGFRIDIIRETLLLIAAMVSIDILSFAQTSLLIRYARRAERSYELIFIAYADIVLTLSIFCFVLPIFLTLNQIMIPESGKRADVFIQLSPISKEDEQDALRKSLQAPLGPPAPGEPPEPSSEDDDNDLEKILRSDIDRDAEIKEFAKSAGAQLIELRL
jgi:hypothetical protein